eukprot:g20072.t1
MEAAAPGGTVDRDKAQDSLIRSVFPGENPHRKPRLDADCQQDAREFLLKIFEGARESEVDGFGFFITEKITCSACNKMHISSHNLATELCLGFPEDPRGSSPSLEALAASFFESTSTGTGYKCPSCGKVDTCSHTKTAEADGGAPLVVMLKSYNEAGQKYCVPVDIPARLDLQRFGFSFAHRLRAVVRHRGRSVLAGHYTAVTRAGASYTLHDDDAPPQRVSEKAALGAVIDKRARSINAPYILFYEPEEASEADAGSGVASEAGAGADAGADSDSDSEEGAEAGAESDSEGKADPGEEPDAGTGAGTQKTPQTPGGQVVAGGSRGEIVADTGRAGLTACGVLDLLNIVSSKERILLTAVLQNSENFQSWLFKQKLPNLLAMEKHQVPTIGSKAKATESRFDVIVHALPSEFLTKGHKVVGDASYTVEGTKTEILTASTPGTGLGEKIRRLCIAANPPFFIGQCRSKGTGIRTAEEERGGSYWDCESCTEGDCSVDTKIVKLLPDAGEDSRPTLKQIANWQHRQRLKLESEMELKSPAAVESWARGAYRSVDVFFDDPDSVDDVETLLVGYHCTEKSGVVMSFTTRPLLQILQHAAPRSGSTTSPFFSSDTRYGQLEAQLGICTSGLVVLTLDRDQATRSSLYWFLYSVISVECQETFETVAGHLIDLYARSVGVKLDGCAAMTFGHDGRPGQEKGVDAAVAQRAAGVRVSHSVDFFHVIKNIGDQVPRQLVASGKQNKKPGKTTLGDFQKMAATIAHRVRQWVWFIRLLFNL